MLGSPAMTTLWFVVLLSGSLTVRMSITVALTFGTSAARCAVGAGT